MNLTTWRVEYSERAKRALRKLDKPVRDRIRAFVRELPELSNPRLKGERLSGPLGIYWRYRVGAYRIICDIQDDVLTIEVVTLGHRSDIYKSL